MFRLVADRSSGRLTGLKNAEISGVTDAKNLHIKVNHNKNYINDNDF